MKQEGIEDEWYIGDWDLNQSTYPWITDTKYDPKQNALMIRTHHSLYDVPFFPTSLDNICADMQNIRYADFGYLNTVSVRSMNSLFMGCNSLVEIDLSSWSTSACTTFNYAFSKCMNLTTIYASDKFTTRNAIAGENDSVFYTVPNLVGGEGTKYDPNNTDISYARIDTLGNPGYFTQAPQSPVHTETFAIPVYYDSSINLDSEFSDYSYLNKYEIARNVPKTSLFFTEEPKGKLPVTYYTPEANNLSFAY